MAEQHAFVEGAGDLGGTMRLGLYPADLKEGTVVRAAYGEARVEERHRHRYEVNNAYREQLEAAGIVFSGTSPDNNLVEFVELPADVHPYYVATQAHPELRSRPTRPHPLFAGLIGAAIQRQRELLIPIDESALRRRWVADDDVTMDEPEAAEASEKTGDPGPRPCLKRPPVCRTSTSAGRSSARASCTASGCWRCARTRCSVPGTPRRPSAGSCVEHPGAALVLAVDDQRAGLLHPAVPPRGGWGVRRAPGRDLRPGGRGPAA